MRRGTRVGFTLIELLVVISIIALLISLLLPALGKAKETTQQVLCLSNLKQIAMASVEFAGEHRNKLPYNVGVSWISVASSVAQNYYDESKGNFVDNFYHQLREPLGGDDTVWRCPTAEPVDSPEYQPASSGALIAYMGNTYAIGIEDYPVAERLPKELDSIPRPSDTVIFTDWGWLANTVWTSQSNPGNVTSHGQPGAIHYAGGSRAGINAAYADGHAAFIGGQTYIDGPGNYFDGDGLWWRQGIYPPPTGRGGRPARH